MDSDEELFDRIVGQVAMKGGRGVETPPSSDEDLENLIRQIGTTADFGELDAPTKTTTPPPKAAAPAPAKAPVPAVKPAAAPAPAPKPAEPKTATEFQPPSVAAAAAPPAAPPPAPVAAKVAAKNPHAALLQAIHTRTDTNGSIVDDSPKRHSDSLRHEDTETLFNNIVNGPSPVQTPSASASASASSPPRKTDTPPKATTAAAPSHVKPVPSGPLQRPSPPKEQPKRTADDVASNGSADSDKLFDDIVNTVPVSSAADKPAHAKNNEDLPMPHQVPPTNTLRPVPKPATASPVPTPTSTPTSAASQPPPRQKSPPVAARQKSPPVAAADTHPEPNGVVLDIPDVSPAPSPPRAEASDQMSRDASVLFNQALERSLPIGGTLEGSYNMANDSFIDDVLATENAKHHRHGAQHGTELEDHNNVDPEFSLEEEQDILNSIRRALDDQESSVQTELGTDTLDVNKVIESAQRIVSGVSEESHTTVIHSTELHSLVEEIKRAKGTSGWPQCIAVGPTSAPVHIALGTTLGLVLLFNAKYKMVGVCGSIRGGESGSADNYRGSATAVDLSDDGAMLLAGYERGGIVLWDTKHLEPLKMIMSEFHAPVLRAAFLHPDCMKVAAFDASGTVKLLTFGRVMTKFVFRTNAITTNFSIPCNDLAVTYEMLPHEDNPNELFMMHYVAMVSGDGLLVTQAKLTGLQNELDDVFHCHSTSAFAGKEPLEMVAWVNRKKKALCVYWGGEVEIIALVSTPDGCTMARISKIKVAQRLRSMAYLQADCLVALDDHSAVHILDTAGSCVAESLPLLHPEVVSVSHPSFGEKFLSSVSVCNGVGIVLGRSKVTSLSIISWESRIDALVTLKLWEEALNLAKSFALDVAVAVVGLTDNPAVRRQEIHGYITSLLTMYVAETLRKKPPLPELRQFIKSIIAYCSEVQATDVLFGPVLNFFRNLKMDKLLMYHFESAMLAGTVTSMPEYLVHAMVDLFLSGAAFDEVNDPADSQLPPGTRIENALMHLADNPNELLALAQKLKLARLACSVLSLRKHQPVQPVDTYLMGHDDELAVVVQYLTRTFAGQSLMEDAPLPPYHQSHFKKELLAALFQQKPQNKRLSELLLCDAVSMVRAIRTAAMDASATAPWKSNDFTLTKTEMITATMGILIDRQIPINKPWAVEAKKSPPYDAVVDFSCLVCQLLASGAVKLDADIQKEFITRTSHHLTYVASKQKKRQAELEGILSALILSPACSLQDATHMVQQLRTAKFLRALTAAYEKDGDYAAALRVYLAEDEDFPGTEELMDEAFPFINTAIKRCPDAASRRRLCMAVKDSIEHLVSIDATAMAQFVFEYMPNEHEELMSTLSASSEARYLYMKEVISTGGAAVAGRPDLQNSYLELLCEHNPSGVYRYLVANDKDLEYDINLALQHCKEHDIVDASVYLLEKTTQIQEAMDLLLSRLEKTIKKLRLGIMKQVKSRSTGNTPSTSSEFSPRATITDVSFNMDMSAGLSLLSPTSSSGHLHEAPGQMACHEENDEVMRMVVVGVELGTRNRQTLDDNEVRDVWFKFLDAFAIPKRVLFERLQHSNALAKKHVVGIDETRCDELAVTKQFVEYKRQLAFKRLAADLEKPTVPLPEKPLSRDDSVFHMEMQLVYTRFAAFILSHMVKALPLQTVVGKIVDDNKREPFGPFKRVIADILENLSFDHRVYSLCKLCTDADTFSMGEELKKVLCGGVQPKSEFCSGCGRHLSEWVAELDALRYFQCGHGYHENCAVGAHECPSCQAALSGAHNAQKAMHSHEGSTKRKHAKVGEPKDIPRIVRRLKHTRAKLDGAINTKEVLNQCIEGKSTLASMQKRFATRALVLSPAPRQPPDTAVQRRHGNLPQPRAVHEIPQDDAIELFGEAGLFQQQNVSMVYAPTSASAVSGQRVDSGGVANSTAGGGYDVYEDEVPDEELELEIDDDELYNV